MLGGVWAIYLIGGISQHLSPAGDRLGEALAIVTVTVLPLAALLVSLALRRLVESERRSAAQ
jgi:hypothetical protein